LYVTISQYRYAPGQPHINDPAHRRLPDPSGLSNRALLFTPSAAQRSDSFSRPTGGSSSDRFLAIDYQLLQHTSPPMAAIEQTVPLVQQEAMSNRESLAGAKRSESQSDALAQREAEIHTLKDLVIKKDLELEVLRKELLSVRKQLDSQKRNPARSSKPQHIAP
ncbi:MAG: hypothetical protein Q8S75_11285, partial [Nitrospirota bacterium]|nr:hypothetical protein [Nitrospirota bacterium]